MLNETAQAVQTRNPIGLAISMPRLPLRSRKAQEPAASPTEVERGSTVLSTTKVRQALTKIWGWA